MQHVLSVQEMAVDLACVSIKQIYGTLASLHFYTTVRSGWVPKGYTGKIERYEICLDPVEKLKSVAFASTRRRGNWQ